MAADDARAGAQLNQDAEDEAVEGAGKSPRPNIGQIIQGVEVLQNRRVPSDLAAEVQQHLASDMAGPSTVEG